ncbi:MAG: peptidase [Parvularculaceae bacterium]|nr:MAG: peptidase [Parvularculaceae bacterium]
MLHRMLYRTFLRFALAGCVFMSATLAPGYSQQMPTPVENAGAASGTAIADNEFWPGARYDANIPTMKRVLGYAPGEKITSPSDALRYMRALAAAAPDRVKIFDYATSWQGRPLAYAAIGSAENIKKLGEVKAAMQALADPRKTNDAAAALLIDQTPGTAWLGYAVHGNEISTTDAALYTAYHLLAALGDPVTQEIHKNAVVFIDPVQNPDGRARFVSHFENTLGLAPSGSRIAAERREPWPSGRMNHYLFDLNRDWYTQSQPESRGKTAAILDWKPLIVVDLHEMGTDSTYYFAPAAQPLNPHLTEGQLNSVETVGRNNAKWFDRFGFPYFIKDVYDGLYPGYGDTWPAFYGAASLTYEQASPRGLKAQRTDGTGYTYGDAVRNHFVASISTAQTAAAKRKELLATFYDYNKTAVTEGQKEPRKTYIFPARDDSVAAWELAELLTRQGIKVQTAQDDFTSCGKAYKRGAHIVRAAQPAKRLIRTLLDSDSPMDAAFIKEQERRRAKGLGPAVYDVTGWSLPVAHNVDMAVCNAALPVSDTFKPFDTNPAKGVVTGPRAASAYLVEWGNVNAVRFLTHALRDGLHVKSADSAMTIGERTFAAGTLIFETAANDRDLRTRLARIAAHTGANVQALASTWVDAGPSFGGAATPRIDAPNIALAWDAPTDPLKAGATRFVLERRLDYPVTPVRVAHLGDKGLDQFDVLILPGARGRYDTALGTSGTRALQDWVRRGGVLISIAEATRWLANPDTNLLSIRRENAATRGGVPSRGEKAGAFVDGVLLENEAAATKATEPAKERPDPSLGVLGRAQVDADHWLGAGVKPTIATLINGGDIYTPITQDNGVNIARFVGANDLLASGYLWEETAKQFAYKPFVVVERHGDGMVIAFTQDPTFRAQMNGLDILLANAVLRAPAHSRKLR